MKGRGDMKNQVTLRENKQTLYVSVKMEQPAEMLILRLLSNRNQPLVTYSDRSPREPARVQCIPSPMNASEVYLPVIDFALDTRFFAEASFEGNQQPSLFALNHHLWHRSHATDKTIEIPGYQLLEWENLAYVQDRHVVLKQFSLGLRVPVLLSPSQAMEIPLRLLAEGWSGRVCVNAVRNGMEEPVGQASIQAAVPQRRERGTVSLDKDVVMDALRGCISYILGSENTCVHSPLRGGMYLLYDMDANTYRQPAWLWGWGPAIRALLECRKIPEITALFPANMLLRRAWEAGEATLKGIVAQENPELDGLCTARWDPNPAMPGGVRERINVAADSGFLCGWAWCALYEATKDARFLHAARKYVHKTNAFVDLYGIPPQDYWSEENRLSRHTLDESGFGVEAHAALYALEKDPQVRAMGKRYMDNHLRYFERLDGLWERAYYWQDHHTDPCVYMTRGLGWAMEGLLATFELTLNRSYLDKACRLAKHLMEAQTEEGCWAFALNQPPQEVGYDDKGTPLWSLLFYRLYRHTKDLKHLKTARSALGYCIAHQVVAGEAQCIGALAAANPHAGIVYRPWYKISCLYAAGFFAIALMEEYSLIVLSKSKGKYEARLEDGLPHTASLVRQPLGRQASFGLYAHTLPMRWYA